MISENIIGLFATFLLRFRRLKRIRMVMLLGHRRRWLVVGLHRHLG